MSSVKIGDLFRKLGVQELKNRLSESSDVFIVNFEKVESSSMCNLRKELGQSGARMFVSKNSYSHRVMKDLNKGDEVTALISGPTAFIFVKDDPIVTSKTLMDFIKENKELTVKGGFLSDRVLSANDLKFLAGLPSISAVYQQVASTLIAPISKFAMSLNQIVAKLAYALKAVCDKKQS